MTPGVDGTALDRLLADGLLSGQGGELRTTRRWQGAMARAALRLYRERDSGQDLRLPIAVALVDIYGPELDDHTLSDLVETMLPVETRVLGALIRPE